MRGPAGLVKVGNGEIEALGLRSPPGRVKYQEAGGGADTRFGSWSSKIWELSIRV